MCAKRPVLSHQCMPVAQDALIAVAQRFIHGTNGIPPEVYDALAQHMAFMHTSVNEVSVCESIKR